MNKLFFKKITIYFGIVLIIFLLDRFSKLYILSILESSGEVDIYINSYINFILVWNSGIGFGLLSFDDSVIYNAITILIIFINLIIVYLVNKSKDINSKPQRSPITIATFILPCILSDILKEIIEPTRNAIPATDSIKPSPVASVKLKTIGGSKTAIKPWRPLHMQRIRTKDNSPFCFFNQLYASRRSR